MATTLTWISEGHGFNEMDFSFGPVEWFVRTFTFATPGPDRYRVWVCGTRDGAGMGQEVDAHYRLRSYDQFWRAVHWLQRRHEVVVGRADRFDYYNPTIKLKS